MMTCGLSWHSGERTQVQRCGASAPECQDLWAGGMRMRVRAFSQGVPVFSVRVLTHL